MNTTLTSLFADVMGIDEREVTAALSREDDDRWDSLNHLRLITAVEEAFGIRLTMEEIENIRMAGDIQYCPVKNRTDSVG